MEVRDPPAAPIVCPTIGRQHQHVPQCWANIELTNQKMLKKLNQDVRDALFHTELNTKIIDVIPQSPFKSSFIKTSKNYLQILYIRLIPHYQGMLLPGEHILPVSPLFRSHCRSRGCKHLYSTLADEIFCLKCRRQTLRLYI